jgi:SAM-dependent methyltransferase
VAALYTLAILFGAVLLFLVEPMVAKMILPLLGGSPSVWNTCMVFFQAALLAGYAYAHALTARLRPRAQVAVHLVVLAVPLALLPVSVSSGPAAGASPIPWLFGALAVSVGFPFLVLSTTGPLLQRWLASTAHREGRDPYFLYAASNLGSLGALLAYPLLVEPRLPLGTASWTLVGGRVSQSLVWSAGYVAYAALVAVCALLMLSRRTAPAAEAGIPPPDAPPISMSRRLLWLALAFVPSSALLGATTYLTTDIAAIPLLWVLPLAVYLLTFVIAFSRRVQVPVRWWGAGLAVLAVVVAASLWLPYWFGYRSPRLLTISLHLLTLFAVGMVCHGRLAADRPAPERLTGFYLILALGGVLGGVFNAMIAPLVFSTVVEYPLALFLACLLRPAWREEPTDRATRSRILDVALPAAIALAVVGLAALVGRPARGTAVLAPALVAGIPCLACLLLLRRPLRFALGLFVVLAAGWTMAQSSGQRLWLERTFFGVHRVLQFDSPSFEMLDDAGEMTIYEGTYRTLVHGTTKHGSQFLDERLRATPTGYFHRTGPIGEVFRALGGDARPDAVAVVGLGAGTLAAYGRPGQSMTFYEIDPAVVRIATNPDLFTYVRDSKARIGFVVGDGRLALAAAPEGAYGLIVIDAFSSDAIPVHLITREAIRLYLGKLRPGGLLALHITNEYLDLAPVLDAIAADLGIRGLVIEGEVASRREKLERKAPSLWAVLSPNAAALEPLAAGGNRRSLPSAPGPPRDSRFLWTDGFSNVFGVLRR